jgi:hypothetical protein
MDREQTTFGLSRAKIARLMRIGVEKDQAEHVCPVPEDTGELLHDQLAQPLALDRDSNRGVPTSSKMPRQLTVPEPTSTIGNVLRNRTTTVSVLERLKELGRRLFSEGRTAPQRDVGLTIYYGAIASAMVFHNVRITRLSYQELQQPFAALADKTWMPPKFQAIFREACRVCESPQGRRSGASGG